MVIWLLGDRDGFSDVAHCVCVCSAFRCESGFPILWVCVEDDSEGLVDQNPIWNQDYTFSRYTNKEPVLVLLKTGGWLCLSGFAGVFFPLIWVAVREFE